MRPACGRCWRPREEAKKKNLGVGVGLQRRHQTGYLETIKRLQDGAIGDIVAARVLLERRGAVGHARPRSRARREMEYQMRNWYYFNWLCGDHIVEQHIHNLDVINWLKNAYPVERQRHGRPRGAQGQGLRRDLRPPRRRVRVRRRLADVQPVPAHPELLEQRLRARATAPRARADISGGAIMVNGERAWQYRGAKPQSLPGRARRPVRQHPRRQAAQRRRVRRDEHDDGHPRPHGAPTPAKMIKWDDALNSQHQPDAQGFSFDATPPTPSVAVPGVTQVV